MAETIEVKKDIEVTVRCSECGEEVGFSGSGDSFGDLTLDVDVCKCATKDEEE